MQRLYFYCTAGYPAVPIDSFWGLISPRCDVWYKLTVDMYKEMKLEAAEERKEIKIEAEIAKKESMERKDRMEVATNLKFVVSVIQVRTRSRLVQSCSCKCVQNN